MKYAYLTGVGMAGALWLYAYLYLPENRRRIIWCGGAHVLVMLVGFGLFTAANAILRFGSPLVPDFWHPPTLWNLAALTGGVGIEDLIFMFFIGGIAYAIDPAIFGNINIENEDRRGGYYVFAIAFIVAGAVQTFAQFNVMYSLFVFNILGAAWIWLRRRDLIVLSLTGGCVLLIAHWMGYRLFLYVYPDFVSVFYNEQALWGRYIFGVPAEECVYAFTTGLLWTPVYRYLHGLRGNTRWRPVQFEKK